MKDLHVDVMGTKMFNYINGNKQIKTLNLTDWENVDDDIVIPPHVLDVTLGAVSSESSIDKFHRLLGPYGRNNVTFDDWEDDEELNDKFDKILADFPLRFEREKSVKKIQKRTKEFLYEPGRAREALLHDSFMQAGETVPEHLEFCRDKTRADVLETVNKQLQVLYAFDKDLAIRTLAEMIEDYKRHLIKESAIHGDNLVKMKELSKRIVIRMSKYELCQLLYNILEDLNAFIRS